jgi:hypothetical protein
MTGDAFAAFHIGAHKTGTSVLQRYLNRDGDVLDRYGVELISRAELGRFVRWGSALVEDPESFRQRVEQVRQTRHVGIFGSNENIVGRPFVKAEGGRLYPHAPRNIAALGDAIGACRPLIFLSIRPQHEFIESYYLQTVHQGGSKTFRRWLKGVDLAALSWRPLVDALLAAVGPDGFELIDFRLIRQGQEAYIRRFLTRLIPGFDEPIEYSQPVNRSISERGLRIALDVNPLLKPGEHHALRKFLQRHFSNVDQPRPELLHEDEKQELTARYGAEYDELVSAYGQPSPISARANGRND